VSVLYLVVVTTDVLLSFATSYVLLVGLLRRFNWLVDPGSGRGANVFEGVAISAALKTRRTADLSCLPLRLAPRIPRPGASLLIYTHCCIPPTVAVEVQSQRRESAGLRLQAEQVFIRLKGAKGHEPPRTIVATNLRRRITPAQLAFHHVSRTSDALQTR